MIKYLAYISCFLVCYFQNQAFCQQRITWTLLDSIESKGMVINENGEYELDVYFPSTLKALVGKRVKIRGYILDLLGMGVDYPNMISSFAREDFFSRSASFGLGSAIELWWELTPQYSFRSRKKKITIEGVLLIDKDGPLLLQEVRPSSAWLRFWAVKREQRRWRRKVMRSEREEKRRKKEQEELDKEKTNEIIDKASMYKSDQ